MSQPSSLEILAKLLSGTVPAGVDWVDVIGTANNSFVAPRLYRTLNDTGTSRSVDTDALEYLAGIDELNTVRNQKLHAQLLEIAEAFERRNVPLGLIKGAVALAQAPSPKALPRMLVDLDVLTRPADDSGVAEILTDLGYQKFDDSETPYSIGSFYRADTVGAVDVHNRMPDRFFNVISDRDIAERMVTTDFHGHPVLTPDASLRFAVNLCHEMMHDRGMINGFVNLRYLLELIDLSDTGELDTGWLESKFGLRRFELSHELQRRMARHLFPARSFPENRDTALGRALHERRLFKARRPKFGELEWDWILRARRTALWQWIRR